MDIKRVLKKFMQDMKDVGPIFIKGDTVPYDFKKLIGEALGHNTCVSALGVRMHAVRAFFLKNFAHMNKDIIMNFKQFGACPACACHTLTDLMSEFTALSLVGLEFTLNGEKYDEEKLNEALDQAKNRLEAYWNAAVHDRVHLDKKPNSEGGGTHV